ncbi:hypothetical protein [Fusobacterium sp.]|uniref:hypothetical protein n=1 Tax=Fusobacterium sp. TaxID=68766 RepID=UPI0025BF504F|nr:hypothetical protein [Fusobacterium sp.]
MIAVIFSVIIATISIINLKETDGIKTRFLQVNEYITYIKKQDDEIYRILLGSGMGSPYEGKMGDFGESKAIDRQKFGKYKFAMHVQYFVNFTEVGVIGFVLVIFINIYIFINITIKNNHIKNRENIEYIFVIYIITYNLFSLLITLGSPIMAIFSGIVYARYDQLKKEIFLKNSEIKRRF